jgi:release factor glutamine methyltransferase
MYAAQWLQDAQSTLRIHDIDTPRLDALLLLEDTLKKNRAHILAHIDLKLSTTQQTKLNKLLNRRTRHEPMAYILRHVEFYGYEFVINASVLVPRPESETMIDLLKELLAKENKKISSDEIQHFAHTQHNIADIGSGSGALGITAKLEAPECKVDLLEINTAALKMSQTNVEKFTLDISVIKSDLLNSTTTAYDILLCNLPYVPDEFKINSAAAWEPSLAIFGGSDGLNLYRKLFWQVSSLQKYPLYILTESFPSQHKALAKIADACGYAVLKIDDFIQVFVAA